MPHDEQARLDALHRLNLLDTAPSESFDRITRMAGQIFDLPIAAISLTDSDRQWFKSRIGIEHWTIPRENAPCAEVAATAAPILIPDLQADSCYRTSLLADQGVRFYAGAPLTTREGHSLGALCVLGTAPREATAQEMKALDDLAKMVMAQIELQHAFGRLDPLSGLPNRTQFLDDLSDLGRDAPGSARLAVLVDLARHEQLTNGLRVLGASYLDRIVQQAARTITASLDPGCIVYHVGATQFAFVAPPGSDVATCIGTLEGLLRRLRTEERGQFLTATSIGVAPFVAGQTAPAAVLRTAHSAAQDARSCPAMITGYSSTADVAHQRQFRLLNDFRHALESDNQLALAFQPRIDLMTGACVGAEALLRWQHPALGPVSPAEFIPVIEQTSLGKPTTAWVLDRALAQLRRWQAMGIGLTLSINISATNLADPGFADQVQGIMRRHGVAADDLELEVTESAVMGDVANALRQLGDLDAAGLRIAIDDFGTGHSSLAYLQRLPGHVLKIDRSFVSNIVSGERDRMLAQSMVSLAHNLDYRVVAEGVETAEVGACLIAMGCDEAQGFHYARPMPPEPFERWFAEHAGGMAGIPAAA